MLSSTGALGLSLVAGPAHQTVWTLSAWQDPAALQAATGRQPHADHDATPRTAAASPAAPPPTAPQGSVPGQLHQRQWVPCHSGHDLSAHPPVHPGAGRRGQQLEDGVVVHGEASFANVLWHQGGLGALLDLEWARLGPPDAEFATISGDDADIQAPGAADTHLAPRRLPRAL